MNPVDRLGRDRLALAEILLQFQKVDEVLTAHSATSPNDETLARSLITLEPTYQLRMYVVFESILAARAPGHGIANYVQYEVGESRTFDPAVPGAASPTVEWWRLLSRDRNTLAHEDGRPTALSIAETLKLLTSYLSMRTERP